MPGSGPPKPSPRSVRFGRQVDQAVVHGVGHPDGAVGRDLDPLRLVEADGGARQRGAVQGELLHPVVAGVGDVDRVGGHGDAHRVLELAGVRARAADLREARGPTGRRRAGASGGVVRLEPVVAGVGDPDHAVRGHVGVRGVVELPVAASGVAVGLRAGLGQVGGDLLDPVAAGVDGPHAAVRPDGQALGPGEGGVGDAPGPDLVQVGAVGLEALDPVVEPVHHVDLAAVVGRHVHGVRLGEARSGRAGALDRVDRGAGRGEHLDAGAPEVGAVDVARGVDRDPAQVVELALVGRRVRAEVRVDGAVVTERRQPHRRATGDVPAGDPAVARVGDVDGVLVVGEDHVVGEVQLAGILARRGGRRRASRPACCSARRRWATRRTP